MKSTRPRIRVLVGLLLAAAVIVSLHLYLLMVVQHDFWLERSYRNRWAFQDVPTRRGAIVDRQGTVLAEDVPAFSLVLYYRRFRREHPVGLAVHGADLLAEMAGVESRFTVGGVDEAVRAGRWLLRAPCAWLAGRGVDRDQSDDLRFYVGQMLSELDRPTPRAVLEGRGASPDAIVADVVEDAKDVLARLRARAEELDTLAVGLRATRGFDLWERLESYRRACADETLNEDNLYVVDRRVDYPLAARLRLLAERHPGLGLQPSVERQRGVLPGRADLGSLDVVLGGVRPFWREDGEGEDGKEGGDEDGETRPPLLERVVDRTLSDQAVAELVPREPDLPDALEVHLEHAAESQVRRFYVSQGRVGSSGVERTMDAWLAGRPGLRLIERDRSAEQKALWSALDTTPGHDLQLTIDLRLQARAEDALDACTVPARALALVVIDPRTGDVLAIGSRPLRQGDRPVWVSYANVWPSTGSVGSLAKPFVALEQLDATRYGREHKDPATFQPCNGVYHVAGLGRPLTCSGHHGDMARSVVDAIAHSCNLYFFQAAEGLGPRGLQRAFARIGWVKEDGPPGAWQDDVAGLSGTQPPETRASVGVRRHAIGYGVQASALFVARAYAALATGRLPKLRLVATGGPAESVPIGCDPSDLSTVRQGMRGCVDHGTARRVDGLTELGVLGKTGTAEIDVESGANNAWFAGYLTEDQPTLAFAAVAYDVADQAHGGEVAGEMIATFLREVAADPELREIYLPAVENR